LRYLVALLLITGFGIKAGAVPLHIWLPQSPPGGPVAGQRAALGPYD
jgi:hydrogenase-4 component B